MKLTCDRQELSAAVTNVQRAVSAKASMPVLEGILIVAENNKITFTGYNLEIAMITAIDAEVFEEGSIVIAAKLFGDIVRKLPEDKVILETDDKFITYIHSGFADYQIIGIDSREFPELPKIDESEKITFSSGLLKDMIRQTLFAVSIDDSKPVHKGSMFEIENGTLRIISVDGFRLAMRVEPIEYSRDTKFIVPGKALSEVLKIINDEENTIDILVGRRHTVFKVENYSIVSRLLEGTFLDYKTTIPKTVTTEVVLNTRLISDSVERMALLNTDKIQSPVSCYITDGQVKLTCATSVGKANDVLSAKVEGASPLRIGFNNKYLLDSLKNADTDEIKMQFNGPLTPMKIVPTEGDSFVFLVVPMRLRDDDR